jgi:hypothetical protein
MELGKAQRLIGLGLIGISLTGCGGRPTAKSKKPKQPSQVATAAAKADEAPANYASVPAALAAVEQMSESGNPSPRELARIEQWLTSQGSAAAPELGTALADSDEHLAVRITACRALSRLGPAGKQPLLAAASAEPKQLRLKATECLGRLKPTDKAIVDELVAKLDASDFDQRKAALTALATVGPEASKHDPRLVEKLTSLLNDTNQDETIRGLAKTALKKVDPRSGLQNAH